MSEIIYLRLLKLPARNAIIEEAEAVEETKQDNKTIRPEIKDAIDAFEDFIDEYCEFMKNYSDDDVDLISLTEYMDFLYKYEEMEKKMDKLDEDFNDAELDYYMQVMLRCDQKLLAVMPD